MRIPSSRTLPTTSPPPSPVLLARPRYSTGSRCSAVQVRTGLRRGNSSRHFPVSPVNQPPPPPLSHHHSIIKLLMKTLQALATVLELGKHMHLTEIFVTRNQSVRRTGKKPKNPKPLPLCLKNRVAHPALRGISRTRESQKPSGGWGGGSVSRLASCPNTRHVHPCLKHFPWYPEKGTGPAKAAAHCS